MWLPPDGTRSLALKAWPSKPGPSKPGVQGLAFEEWPERTPQRTSERTVKPAAPRLLHPETVAPKTIAAKTIVAKTVATKSVAPNTVAARVHPKAVAQSGAPAACGLAYARHD